MSDTVREKNLGPEKMRALGALLMSGNDKFAAEQSGVNERTVRRWRDEPDFQAALMAAQDAALAGFTMVLASASGPVALGLRSFAINGKGTQSQQLRAMIAIADLVVRQQELAIRRADLAMRQAEHDEFERRLTAVEQRGTA